MNITCPLYCKSPRLMHVLIVIALIFGVATVFSGGQVIFGPEEKRIAVGDYVLFVVWFNFVAGFAYIAAAVGLYRRATWGAYLAIMIAGATALVFVALGVHIYSGGAYEARTVAAMVLRTGLWLLIACVARQSLLRKA